MAMPAAPCGRSSLDTNHLRQVWRVELGPSYSGPIVGADRVFTTESKDRRFEVVTALDRSTGKELWRAQWEGAMSVPFFAKSNGDWVRSTPALDGDRLFVAGMRDVLVCLDAGTADVSRVDLVEQLRTALPAFGFVSSPLVDGDAVFVQAGAALVRLNKHTGKVPWRALEDGGGMGGSAFSSPIIAELAGQRQLLVQTREKLAGVALPTAKYSGAARRSLSGMNILTPVVCGDSMFTSTYGGKTKVRSASGRPV